MCRQYRKRSLICLRYPRSLEGPRLPPLQARLLEVVVLSMPAIERPCELWIHSLLLYHTTLHHRQHKGLLVENLLFASFLLQCRILEV